MLVLFLLLQHITTTIVRTLYVFRILPPLSLINKTVKTLNSTTIKDSIVTGGNSDLTFLLVFQTKAQKELMSKYGNNITLMDGIYSTTKYGFPCIYVTLKTSIGTGMVVATIIPQYENEDLLVEGLTILKEWDPLWLPKIHHDRPKCG